MANRYPFPQHQARPGMAPANPTRFPTMNMWQHQPQAHALNHSQQLHLAEEQRQREYLKQQQKLRLMSATSNKQPVNADKLIENLLETKDMFRPRANLSPSASAVMPNVQIPARHSVPTQVPLMGTGAARPVHYPQAYSALSQHHSSVPVSSSSDAGSGLAKRTPQENSRVGFQLPAWLSSQSPSLPTLYRHVWTLVGMDKGLVDTAKIFPLLLTSGLPTDVLGYIWGLANQKIAGQLTEDELYIVLALVGLAQSGCTFNNLSILNLIQQVPIPNLNLSSFQPPAMRTESTVQSPGEDSSQALGVACSVISESPVTFSAPLPSVESVDDFSDFQSAVCSQEPESQSEPHPGPIQDSPIHIKEAAASTPSVAFQGISPSSDGHKFQSIFSLGSSSRGIGSRLANHSLGAPKQTKSRHHKHHHHHHHHHHHRTAHCATHPSTHSEENSEQPGQQMTGAASPEEDDFSDFQQAKEPVLTQTAGADELFPKCALKTPPKKPYVLKESAIRSDKTETSILFESPVHMKVNLISNEKETNTTVDSRVSFGPSGYNTKVNVVRTPDLQTPTTHELLSVEEDKYSALRALSISVQEPTDSKETVPDDFGDFLSAEPTSTEDSFAALAARDIQPKTGEVVSETNSFWPSATVTPQSAEFQLDDWGTFESTPEIRVSASTSTSNDLLSTNPIESSVSGLSSALQGLDLKTAGIDFSWNAVSKGGRKEVEKGAAALVETSTTSPAPSTSASDSWMEPNDEFSQSQSTYKGYGLTFLGKIYNDHNQVISNTKNDLFVLENEPQAVNGSFVIKTEEDDEFGEFIGPEAWPEDSKFTAKETAFEGQAVLRVKDATCDTQSVSSLELPVLSRHGSLPSLDLKIFPSGSDKSGLLQPWDCSPQGIDLQIKEWCRCLQSCLQLLQAALATFTSISNELVVEEVVTVHEGKEYLLNLLEVYGICKRVKQSATGITSDSKLDSILAEVDIVWSSMEPYFIKAEIKLADMEFGCNASNGSQEQSACGICLTSVGSEIIQDNHNNIYPLEYGGQVYHAACANLWVNCVDCRLPALATTGSLL